MSDYETLIEKDNADKTVDMDKINSITSIGKGMYLSSKDAGCDSKQLFASSIRGILDVSEYRVLESTENTYKKMGIKYIFVPIQDMYSGKLMENCPVCYKHITDLKNFGNVLIYCMSGLSTSVCIAAYYYLRALILQNPTPGKKMLTAVLQKISSIRTHIDINDGFLEQLEDLEAEMFGIPVVDDHSLSLRRNKKKQQEQVRRFQMEMDLDKKEAVQKWTVEPRRRF